MSFATESAKRSATPIVIVTMVLDDGTTYRWSHGGWTDPGTGEQYEPRLLSAGTVSRQVRRGSPVVGDVEIELANTDGALDDVLSRFDLQTKDLLRATITVKRGYLGMSAADFQTRLTSQYVRMRGDVGRRSVRLRLSNTPAGEWGQLAPPTVEQVADAINAAGGIVHPTSGANVEITPLESMRQETVPIVYGAWLHGSLGPTALDDLWVVTKNLDTPNEVAIVAISRWTFEEDFGIRNLWVASLNAYVALFYTNHWNADRIASGWRVWNRSPDDVTAGNFNGLLNPLSIAAWHNGFRHWPDVLEGVLPCGSTQAPVDSTTIDEDSFRRAKSGTATHARAVVAEPIEAIDFIGQVAEAYMAGLYYREDGRLAASTSKPEGSEPAPVVVVDEHSNVIGSASYRRPGPGEDHGPINALDYVLYYPWNVEDPPKRRVVIDSARVRHGRVFPIERDTHLYPNYDTVRGVAREIAARWIDPRNVVDVTLPLAGAVIDLDDVVKVVHNGIPGCADGRYFLVESLRDDLDRHTITMTLVDWHTYLTANLYHLDSEDNWIALAGSTNGVTATTLADPLKPSIVELGGLPTGYTVVADYLTDAQIIEGDHLVFRAWSSSEHVDGLNFSIHKILGIEETGLAVDPPPAIGETTLSWRVYRGHPNRSVPSVDPVTATTIYTPRDIKYGVPASSDGTLPSGDPAYLFDF